MAVVYRSEKKKAPYKLHAAICSYFSGLTSRLPDKAVHVSDHITDLAHSGDYDKAHRLTVKYRICPPKYAFSMRFPMNEFQRHIERKIQHIEDKEEFNQDQATKSLQNFNPRVATRAVMKLRKSMLLNPEEREAFHKVVEIKALNPSLNIYWDAIGRLHVSENTDTFSKASNGVGPLAQQRAMMGSLEEKHQSYRPESEIDATLRDKIVPEATPPTEDISATEKERQLRARAERMRSGGTDPGFVRIHSRTKSYTPITFAELADMYNRFRARTNRLKLSADRMIVSNPVAAEKEARPILDANMADIRRLQGMYEEARRNSTSEEESPEARIIKNILDSAIYHHKGLMVPSDHAHSTVFDPIRRKWDAEIKPEEPADREKLRARRKELQEAHDILPLEDEKGRSFWTDRFTAAINAEKKRQAESAETQKQTEQQRDTAKELGLYTSLPNAENPFGQPTIKELERRDVRRPAPSTTTQTSGRFTLRTTTTPSSFLNNPNSPTGVKDWNKVLDELRASPSTTQNDQVVYKVPGIQKLLDDHDAIVDRIDGRIAEIYQKPEYQITPGMSNDEIDQMQKRRNAEIKDFSVRAFNDPRFNRLRATAGRLLSTVRRTTGTFPYKPQSQIGSPTTYLSTDEYKDATDARQIHANTLAAIKHVVGLEAKKQNFTQSQIRNLMNFVGDKGKKDTILPYGFNYRARNAEEAAALIPSNVPPRQQPGESSADFRARGEAWAAQSRLGGRFSYRIGGRNPNESFETFIRRMRQAYHQAATDFRAAHDTVRKIQTQAPGQGRRQLTTDGIQFLREGTPEFNRVLSQQIADIRARPEYAITPGLSEDERQGREQERERVVQEERARVRREGIVAPLRTQGVPVRRSDTVEGDNPAERALFRQALNFHMRRAADMGTARERAFQEVKRFRELVNNEDQPMDIRGAASTIFSSLGNPSAALIARRMRQWEEQSTREASARFGMRGRRGAETPERTTYVPQKRSSNILASQSNTSTPPSRGPQGRLVPDLNALGAKLAQSQKYNNEQINDIIGYVRDTGTTVGAPHLDNEDKRTPILQARQDAGPYIGYALGSKGSLKTLETRAQQSRARRLKEASDHPKWLPAFGGSAEPPPRRPEETDEQHATRSIRAREAFLKRQPWESLRQWHSRIGHDEFTRQHPGESRSDYEARLLETGIGQTFAGYSTTRDTSGLDSQLQELRSRIAHALAGELYGVRLRKTATKKRDEETNLEQMMQQYHELYRSRHGVYPYQLERDKSQRNHYLNIKKYIEENFSQKDLSQHRKILSDLDKAIEQKDWLTAQKIVMSVPKTLYAKIADSDKRTSLPKTEVDGITLLPRQNDPSIRGEPLRRDPVPIGRTPSYTLFTATPREHFEELADHFYKKLGDNPSEHFTKPLTDFENAIDRKDWNAAHDLAKNIENLFAISNKKSIEGLRPDTQDHYTRLGKHLERILPIVYIKNAEQFKEVLSSIKQGIGEKYFKERDGTINFNKPKGTLAQETLLYTLDTWIKNASDEHLDLYKKLLSNLINDSGIKYGGDAKDKKPLGYLSIKTYIPIMDEAIKNAKIKVDPKIKKMVQDMAKASTSSDLDGAKSIAAEINKKLLDEKGRTIFTLTDERKHDPSINTGQNHDARLRPNSDVHQLAREFAGNLSYDEILKRSNEPESPTLFSPEEEKELGTLARRHAIIRNADTFDGVSHLFRFDPNDLGNSTQFPQELAKITPKDYFDSRLKALHTSIDHLQTQKSLLQAHGNNEVKGLVAQLREYMKAPGVTTNSAYENFYNTVRTLVEKGQYQAALDQFKTQNGEEQIAKLDPDIKENITNARNRAHTFLENYDAAGNSLKELRKVSFRLMQHLDAINKEKDVKKKDWQGAHDILRASILPDIAETHKGLLDLDLGHHVALKNLTVFPEEKFQNKEKIERQIGDFNLQLRPDFAAEKTAGYDPLQSTTNIEDRLRLNAESGMSASIDKERSIGQMTGGQARRAADALDMQTKAQERARILSGETTDPVTTSNPLLGMYLKHRRANETRKIFDISDSDWRDVTTKAEALRNKKDAAGSQITAAGQVEPHTISNPVEPTSTVSTEPPPADGGIPATPTRTKQGARAVVREQDKFLESLHDETVSHGKTLITGKGGEDAAARHAKIVQWHVDRWRPIWNNEKPDGTFFKPQEIKSNLQQLKSPEVGLTSDSPETHLKRLAETQKLVREGLTDIARGAYTRGHETLRRIAGGIENVNGISVVPLGGTAEHSRNMLALAHGIDAAPDHPKDADTTLDDHTWRDDTHGNTIAKLNITPHPDVMRKIKTAPEVLAAKPVTPPAPEPPTTKKSLAQIPHQSFEVVPFPFRVGWFR